MAGLSPCAGCGKDVTSAYTCPGPCGRSIHHFCGKRQGDLSEDPRHGEPILCPDCESSLVEEDDEEEINDDENEEEATNGTAAQAEVQVITSPQGQHGLNQDQGSGKYIFIWILLKDLNSMKFIEHVFCFRSCTRSRYAPNAGALESKKT